MIESLPLVLHLLTRGPEIYVDGFPGHKAGFVINLTTNAEWELEKATVKFCFGRGLPRNEGE